MKTQLNEVKKLQKTAGILNEVESAEQELYRLKQSFMPDFEDFVELNLIAKLEDNDNIGYTEQEKDFARQLKDVLFKLKHGEI